MWEDQCCTEFVNHPVPLCASLENYTRCCVVAHLNVSRLWIRGKRYTETYSDLLAHAVTPDRMVPFSRPVGGGDPRRRRGRRRLGADTELVKRRWVWMRERATSEPSRRLPRMCDTPIEPALVFKLRWQTEMLKSLGTCLFLKAGLCPAGCFLEG